MTWFMTGLHYCVQDSMAFVALNDHLDETSHTTPEQMTVLHSGTLFTWHLRTLRPRLPTYAKVADHPPFGSFSFRSKQSLNLSA